MRRHHGVQHNRGGWELALVGALVCALALTFSWTTLTRSTLSLQQAGIGTSAAVAPTELNQITAELTRREGELAERERAVAAAEAELQTLTRDAPAPLPARAGNAGNTFALLYTTLVSVALLSLILLNFRLDARRTRRDMRVRIAQRSPASERKVVV